MKVTSPDSSDCSCNKGKSAKVLSRPAGPLVRDRELYERSYYPKVCLSKLVGCHVSLTCSVIHER